MVMREWSVMLCVVVAWSGSNGAVARYPTLDDAWEGRAVLVPEVWRSGGSYTGRQWLMESPTGHLWDFTTEDNYKPNVNCMSLFESSDGGVSFTGPVQRQGSPCLAPNADIQQQQYPSVVRVPDGKSSKLVVVYEEGAATWWRTSVDGVEWSDRTQVDNTGACLSNGAPYELKHCGGCSTPPHNTCRGAPPGLWRHPSTGELFLFVDGGACPACVLCFRGASLDAMRLCDHNPLVKSGVSGSFDWHFLSGVQVIESGGYLYMSYQGEVDLPHLGWAIGLARVNASATPDTDQWEKLGPTGIWYQPPVSSDGTHSHTLIRDGKTLVYYRRSRQVWKDLPEGHCGRLVRTATPIGISAYGGLADSFPRTWLFQALSLFESPFVTVALDFGRLLEKNEYNPTDVSMFLSEDIGNRKVNPAHLSAIRRFLTSYVEGTPLAAARHLQFFLFNGPTYRQHRNELYPLAYNISEQELNDRLVSDSVLRGEVSAYISAVASVVSEFADGEQMGSLRFTVSLEDNMPVASALAVVELAQSAGWRWEVGRNPCPGCFPGLHPPNDGDRLGLGHYTEFHIGNREGINKTAEALMVGDTYSNDGYPGNITDSDISAMATAAQTHGLLLHYWYSPLQGYTNYTTISPHIYVDRPPCVLAHQIAAGIPNA